MPSGNKPGPKPGVRDASPRTHNWNFAGAGGWRHGPIPDPPEALTPTSRRIWDAWFGSWWAYFWDPSDLDAIYALVVSWADVIRGDIEIGKVITALDRYGITPKGRQDLRWAPPEEEADPKAPTGPGGDMLETRRKARADKIA